MAHTIPIEERPLSKREIEVIKLICDGYNSQEIAGMLLLSLKTVEVHRFNIMKKTKLKNAVSVVIYAIKSGIYPIELPAAVAV